MSGREGHEYGTVGVSWMWEGLRGWVALSSGGSGVGLRGWGRFPTLGVADEEALGVRLVARRARGTQSRKFALKAKQGNKAIMKSAKTNGQSKTRVKHALGSEPANRRGVVLSGARAVLSP
jgi:hypothetical protein